MPDDGSVEGATWHLPKFRFEVDFGAGLDTIAFQEVSGMDVENQIIEYRNTNSTLFSNDDIFWKWCQEIKMNTIKRTIILIKLLDDDGSVTMQWKLINAWPEKISSSDLKSNGSDVAIETLEIAHEQLIISQE